MTNATKNTTSSLPKKADAIQITRDIGASFMSLPGYIESLCEVNYAVNRTQLSIVAKSIRETCSALIKTDYEVARESMNLLEKTLNEAQQKRIESSIECEENSDRPF